jgi:CheY-like chemotaxis protein
VNADGSIRIYGSLQDINFIKVAEDALRTGRDQARAANKAKSDFIAVMSHEVRTPLNAILGSVDLLKRGVHDPEAQEMIELIDEAGRGLLSIVNDLLDVSRIDAGKLEITNAPTDICSLMRRTVEFWTPQASDKGLSLRVEIAGDDGLQLMLDAGRIRQIIGNLISNAIKFTDTGSVTARLALQPTRDGRVQVAISVVDTGPGVPAAVAESIFAPFEQAPGDASRGGAGLGLFISRRLARMMGGDLTLEPPEGKGAHFCLSLVAARMGQDGQEAGVDTAEAVSWDGLHLLCVDDNENNRRIAELLLSRLGFQVTLAASGAEAIDLCAMQVFDIILMDIVMPEQDGMQTLRQLRGDDESLNRATPAIALTAKLAPADLADYSAAGFEGVAGKPIDVAALAAQIPRIIP